MQRKSSILIDGDEIDLKKASKVSTLIFRYIFPHLTQVDEQVKLDGMTNLLLNSLIWKVLLFLVFINPSNPPQTEVVSIHHENSLAACLKVFFLPSWETGLFIWIYSTPESAHTWCQNKSTS